MSENTFDYNRDNQVDAADQQLADMDKDGNRRVSDKERQAYLKKQGKSTTTFEYDSEGNIIKQQTKTNAVDNRADISAADLGYVPAFLKTHTEIRDAVALAIKYDWTEQQFINYVERETTYGRNHTASQELFDMRSVDPAFQKDYEVLLNNKKSNILEAARSAGVSLSDQAAADFARKAVRNNLDDSAVRAFIARQFTMPQPINPTNGQEVSADLTGRASVIESEIKNMANNYGVTVTSDQIGQMVKQGLKEQDTASWLRGKENIFRSQAKTIYKNIAPLLDTMTTAEVLSPYLGMAAETLGLNVRTMKITDPRWTKAFSGDGGPMSNEEWIRTLKTDSTYQYSKTQKAKVEASQMAQSILSVLGG
jgi:hypothetical protein